MVQYRSLKYFFQKKYYTGYKVYRLENSLKKFFPATHRPYLVWGTLYIIYFYIYSVYVLYRSIKRVYVLFRFQKVHHIQVPCLGSNIYFESRQAIKTHKVMVFWNLSNKIRSLFVHFSNSSDYTAWYIFFLYL